MDRVDRVGVVPAHVSVGRVAGACRPRRGGRPTTPSSKYPSSKVIAPCLRRMRCRSIHALFLSRARNARSVRWPSRLRHHLPLTPALESANHQLRVEDHASRRRHPGLRISCISSRVISRPISSIGCRTLESDGCVVVASGESSKPTIGHITGNRPARRAQRSHAPTAMRSDATNTASMPARARAGAPWRRARPRA